MGAHGSGRQLKKCGWFILPRINKPLGIIQASSKIMDITTSVTTKQTCDISAHVPPNAVLLIVHAKRASGTGALNFYPNSHASEVQQVTNGESAVISIASQELCYALTVGNDDWDLWLDAYVMEGEVKK